MAIDTKNSWQEFTADGKTAYFAFNFNFTDELEIVVGMRTGENKFETVEPSNYQIIKNASEDGGQIRFIQNPSGSAEIDNNIPDGTVVRIERRSSLTSSASWQLGLEMSQMVGLFDRLFRLAQENKGRFDNVVKTFETQHGVKLYELLEEHQDKMFFWDNEKKTITPTKFPYQDVVQCVDGLYLRIRSDIETQAHWLEWSKTGEDPWYSSKGYMDYAVKEAKEAKELSNQAVTTANSANTKSDEALETSKRAETNSSNAVKTANESKEIAENAKTTADSAVNTAQEAVNVAKEAKETASKAYHFKGSVNTVDSLPKTGQQEGDVYNVIDTGMNYAWTGTEWDALGSIVDLSDYETKENANKEYGDLDGKITALQHLAVETYETKDNANTTKEALESAIGAKQDKLIAGANITIEDGVISATGGGALPDNVIINQGGRNANSVTLNPQNEPNAHVTGDNSIAIGYRASTPGGNSIHIGAIGTVSGQFSIGIGHEASASAAGAIQLNSGTNSTPNSLCVSAGQNTPNYMLLKDGLIPAERLATGGVIGQYLALTENGMEWKTVEGGGGSGLPAMSDDTAGKYLTNEGGAPKWGNYSPLIQYSNFGGIRTWSDREVTDKNNMSFIEMRDGSATYSNSITITTGGGVAGGWNSIYIGNNPSGIWSAPTRDGSIGIGSKSYAPSDTAIAIGYQAKAFRQGAIQIGNGENNTAQTLQVSFNDFRGTVTGKDYILLDSDGHIPDGRLPQVEELRNKIDIAGTSGKIVGSYWFGKTKAETVVPAPTIIGQNYYDFTTGNVYKSNDGATWTLVGENVPPADIDVQIMITSKFWDITEQENQHGGKAWWSHTNSEWSYSPVIREENQGGSGVGRDVGDVFYTARLDNKLNGAVECNGARYNLSDINSGQNNLQDLLTRGALSYISLDEHVQAIASNGSCRAFGWDGGDVVAVPKIAGRFLVRKKEATADDPSWYNIYSDGFCEQGSHFPGANEGNTEVNLVLPFSNTAYCLTRLNNWYLDGTTKFQYEHCWSKTTTGFSTWNSTQSTYGNGFDWSASGYVLPDEYSQDKWNVADIQVYRPMVHLFNGATDNAVATATGVLADVAELKNMMGLVSGRFLVRKKEWVAVDEPGFNLYSDGYMEVFGSVQTTAGAWKNIDLPCAFMDTNYSVVLARESVGNIAGNTPQAKAVSNKQIGFASAYISDWRNDVVYFTACGYADPSEYAADKWNVRPSANGLLWLPVAPSANGTYSLGLTMQNGTPTPYWGQSFVRPPSAPERYLVRKKRATDTDPSWYNLYSDGWVEQGSFEPRPSADRTTVVTLPIKMADTNYWASKSVTLGTNDTGSTAFYTGFRAYTTTTVSFRQSASSSYINGDKWHVEGYADPTEYTNDKWGDDTDYSQISVMTGDPSPFKFKAWTNAGGETVYTLLAVPVAQGDDMYPEDQLAVVNAGNVPKVVGHCGAIGIVNGNRAINGGGTIMGTPGTFDSTDAYVRNQALDTNG